MAFAFMSASHERGRLPPSPTKLEMHRLLLIEDDHHIASFVRQGLEEEGYQVEWSDTGLAGERQALSEPFDAILLDLRLPDISGMDICKTVRKHNTAVPILMLTALDDVQHKVEGLRCGADDYLPKPFAFEELIARIEALLRRSALEPAERIYQDGALMVDLAERTCAYDDNPIEFTQTEFDLLAYFVTRRGQALSRDEIHKDVWGHDFDRGTNLIDVYVGYVRRKLADAGCPCHIDAVRGVGYRYIPTEKREHADA